MRTSTIGMPFSFLTGPNKCLFFYRTLSWRLVEKQLPPRHLFVGLGVFVGVVIVAEVIRGRTNRRSYSTSSRFCWWGLLHAAVRLLLGIRAVLEALASARSLTGSIQECNVETQWPRVVARNFCERDLRGNFARKELKVAVWVQNRGTGPTALIRL